MSKRKMLAVDPEIHRRFTTLARLQNIKINEATDQAIKLYINKQDTKQLIKNFNKN